MAHSVSKTIDKLINRLSDVNTINKIKTIGTHHGSFHCDEVLACYMLRNHTNEFRNAKIIRSRDPDILSTADIVVDVGAEFDLHTNKFDHHQNSFTDCFSSEFDTKLSSAGLIYKYFGKQIIKDIIINHAKDVETNDKNDAKYNVLDIDDETIEILHQKVYQTFIEGIDGIDNGIKQYDTEQASRFQINTDLSSRIKTFNPWWNQDTNDEIAMKQFYKAMECAGSALIQNVLFIYKGWLPARQIVQNAVQNRFDIDSSGQILKLSPFCPWSEHFFEIHSQSAIDPMPLYVLFEDTKKGWRIRATPKQPKSFDNLKPLPKEWRSKRGEELDQICGLKGCIFVHSTGFIGGHKTYEGALAMAQKALQYS